MARARANGCHKRSACARTGWGTPCASSLKTRTTCSCIAPPERPTIPTEFDLIAWFIGNTGSIYKASTSRLGRPSVGKKVAKQGFTLLQRLGPSHGLQRHDQTRAQSGRALRVEVEDWLSNVMVT